MSSPMTSTMPDSPVCPCDRRHRETKWRGRRLRACTQPGASAIAASATRDMKGPRSALRRRRVDKQSSVMQLHRACAVHASCTRRRRLSRSRTEPKFPATLWSPDGQQARPTRPAPAQAVAHAAAPHRLSDRPRRRAADVSDRLPALGDHRLRRRQGHPADPRPLQPGEHLRPQHLRPRPAGLPGLHHARGRADQGLRRPPDPRVRREPGRAHPDRAADLQCAETDRRSDLRQFRHVVPAGLPGRISAQGPLERRLHRQRHPRRGAAEDRRARSRQRLPSGDPQPRLRLPALRAAPRRHHPRHERRGRRQARHLRRPRRPARRPFPGPAASSPSSSPDPPAMAPRRQSR